MRKIKKLKRISIMLLCVVLLHGGCGSRTTEEIEKVDTTENFDLIGTEGWEYQGKRNSIFMENGQSPVSERGIHGMRRMSGWVLCMSCYRRAVPTKAARNRTH